MVSIPVAPMVSSQFSDTGIHSFFYWIPASRAGMTPFDENKKNLLFSILYKNENKAYLNGDRLLALWSRTLQSAGNLRNRWCPSL
ncbi:hypothetical protein [Wolbachia endosymbiont of Ctenocephalides felis wCfeJ]|uniref:hypothetical protein n=1 Tax=Wolbachia endosymbiont of Ctenocephalides felis wCfeJ TaxID=2732594 RepID=UPI001444DF7F|nr:hypothetical protein [Wolbachia endosymbiont of Ctenocephalides felis wCfeJ]